MRQTNKNSNNNKSTSEPRKKNSANAVVIARERSNGNHCFVGIKGEFTRTARALFRASVMCDDQQETVGRHKRQRCDVETRFSIAIFDQFPRRRADMTQDNDTVSDIKRGCHITDILPIQRAPAPRRRGDAKGLGS